MGFAITFKSTPSPLIKKKASFFLGKKKARISKRSSELLVACANRPPKKRKWNFSALNGAEEEGKHDD